MLLISCLDSSTVHVYVIGEFWEGQISCRILEIACLTTHKAPQHSLLKINTHIHTHTHTHTHTHIKRRMQRCAPFELHLSFLQTRIAQNECDCQQQQETLPNSQNSDWLCGLSIRYWGLLPRRKSGRIANLTSNVSLIPTLRNCKVLPPPPEFYICGSVHHQSILFNNQHDAALNF